jgi:XTP/dITP diphosphohydrolase
MPRTLVVLSARMGNVLPAAALPALRAADRVLADATVAESMLVETGAQRVYGWHANNPLWNEVLLTTDSEHHMRPYAASVIETPERGGVGLLDAVAVMDRLRSPGGCPWDAEQTHASLLQYLVEECYELHEAVENVDRSALREELGDVLLQVLFHARLAAEGAVQPFGADARSAGAPLGADARSAGASLGDVVPFDIDDVAEDLVRKLVGRHPHVFGTGDGVPAERVHSAADQERRWDELKRVEKSRDSALDGVALGQPAVALVAKLISRARKAGLPEALMYDAAPDGYRSLFEAVAKAKLSGVDPERELRVSARSFDRSVRAAEDAARAAGLDPHRLTEADWTRFWQR